MPPLNKGRCPVTIVTGRWGRTLRLWRIVPLFLTEKCRLVQHLYIWGRTLRLWRIVPHLWRIVPLFLTEKCRLVQPIYLR